MVLLLFSASSYSLEVEILVHFVVFLVHQLVPVDHEADGGANGIEEPQINEITLLLDNPLLFSLFLRVEWWLQECKRMFPPFWGLDTGFHRPREKARHR